MFIPSFAKQDRNDPLYFLQAEDSLDAGATALPNYCIAFLPDQTVTATTLSLAETWTLHPGIYLFLSVAKTTLTGAAANAPLTQTTLVESVRRFLQQLGNRPIRFLWLENPADPIALWRLNGLAIAPTPITPNAPIGSVADPTFLSFRNYGLFIAGGSRVALNSASTGLVFRREPGNAEGFYLSTGFDAVRLYGLAEEIELPFAGAIAGCLKTSLTVQKPTTAGQGYGELAALDIGFRLFFPDASQAATQDAFAIATHRYPFLLEDPEALPHYRTDLSLVLTLDPLHALEATRTWFGFGAETQPQSLPSGYYTNTGRTIHLTPHNEQSRLVFAELPTDSFSVADPLALIPYYLVPAGDYEISVPRYAAGASQNPADYDDNLLCGLSGVEYIKLAVPARPPAAVTSPPASSATLPTAPQTSAAPPDPSTLPSPPAGEPQPPPPSPAPAPRPAPTANTELSPPLPASGPPPPTPAARPNLLCCRPGHPAFAPGFVPGQAAVTRSDSTALLTPVATTAWVSIRQIDSTPIYYAQPEQAPLHGAAISDAGATLDGLLGYLEVPALALPSASQPFPLLPYGGVRDRNLAAYLQLEKQFLSPQRRTLLVEQASATLPLVSPTAPAPGTAHTGTTPQGLLATFSAGYDTLEAVTLAQDTANQPLEFRNIERTSPLRAALQSPQLFLVIANPTTLEAHFPPQFLMVQGKLTIQGQLTIQNWKFDLHPQRWRPETVLILKFFEEPLIDLLENLQVWASPAHFVGSPPVVEATQRQLLELFREAIARSGENASEKDKENYGPLAKIAQLAGWSGTVALNVSIPSANLPPELRALAAGIDPNRFYAQYVGIETTPVQSQQGRLVVGQSSLFGLIDYRNETIPLPNQSGYDFEVRNLRVLFQNSQVKAFSSEIAVTLDRLFDEETQLVVRGNNGEAAIADRNLLLLKGTAESHNGRTTYAFSFSGENHFLTRKSTALNQVDIIKAQFSTDPVTTPANQVPTITGRFTFWGNLDFARLAMSRDPFQCDLLSFGSEPPDPASPTGAGAIASPPRFLAFSNLGVTMTFREDTPQNRTFRFDPGHLVFDLKRSKPRPNSLYAKFPLKFTGLTYAPGDKPIERLGYMPVKSPVSGKLRSRFILTDAGLNSLAPSPTAAVLEKLRSLKDEEFLDQQALVATLQATLGADLSDALRKSIVSAAQSPQPWYALTFDLDLGTLGALAGRAGFVASLIFAWNPGAGSPFFVGLRLPGSTGGKREITLQGVIKLVFKSIDLVVGRNQGRISYVLKLKNIMLKFLVLSIPPNGRTEIILFGDPAGTAENNQLGWYAAYIKEQ